IGETLVEVGFSAGSVADVFVSTFQSGLRVIGDLRRGSPGIPRCRDGCCCRGISESSRTSLCLNQKSAGFSPQANKPESSPFKQ
ncbi:MAG TPA: hypothetical protein VEB40_12480, partial [Flavipsychrobacter sp.]|nr:hypothetical protein [Flavipsychrobacter sp.]